MSEASGLIVSDPTPEVDTYIEVAPLATIEIQVSHNDPIIKDILFQYCGLRYFKQTAERISKCIKSHIDCLCLKLDIFS